MLKCELCGGEHIPESLDAETIEHAARWLDDYMRGPDETPFDEASSHLQEAMRRDATCLIATLNGHPFTPMRWNDGPDDV